MERGGKQLGLVFSNYPYTYTLCDLIGGRFGYARVVPCSPEAGGVILPVWKDGAGGPDRIALLKNARHAPRLEMTELPRGHLEPGDHLSQEENAIKELKEELKLDPERHRIEEVINLGCIHPDSGLTAGLVRLFQITVTGDKPDGAIGHEGIRALEWVSIDELKERIRQGLITDAFTKTALLHYLLREDAL